MRIAAEVEAVVADVVRAVDRLALGAQHQRRDQRRELVAGEALEQPGEVLGPREIAAAREPELAQQLAQRLELDRVGPVVDAVHAGPRGLLQRLRRGDVGGDHELLDQPVGIEPLLPLDRDRPAVLVEADRDLGQVEIERAAPPPGVLQRGVGAEQRPHHRLEQRRRDRIRARRPAPPGAARRSAARASASGRAGSDGGASAPWRRATAARRRTARSSPGRSEHSSLERNSGSIGSTRSGK